MSIEDRKSEHIAINLSKDVAGKGIGTGLEGYRFEHVALPDLNLDEIDVATDFLGHRLEVPLLISSMTGGTDEGARINLNLARAAQRLGVAMGLGSSRIALESPAAAQHFSVRRAAPDVLLFANIGAVQLNYRVSARDCQRLVDQLEADALILHLNPLQEAVQPEGDTRFRNLLEKIGEVCSTLTVPVVVKEVGWGLASDVVLALLDAGVAAIDIAGAGGTSWSEVERFRGNKQQQAVAAAFADWGIPTAEALVSVRAALNGAEHSPAGRVHAEVPVIASGGIRNGVDAAKCIALGANLVGMASPFLRAAVASEGAVESMILVFERQLRIAMFATGTPNLAHLRKTPRLRKID